MRTLILFLTVTIFYPSLFAFDLGTAKQRCSITTAGESLVYQDDFENPALHLNSTWWWTTSEMETLFQSTYDSGKRIRHRAYYDSTKNEFLLPLGENFGAPQPPQDLESVTAPESFLISVRQHIEAALKNNYAEYIFFPDMGHSHLYIPQEHWDAEYAPTIEKGPYNKKWHYDKLLADPELRMLYHTAERLLMVTEDNVLSPDPHLQHRYSNRNILGDNRGSSHLEVHFPKVPNKGNTVGGIENFHLWSAGYNLHATKYGCFPFEWRGQILYFDISLNDLGRNPANPPPSVYF